MLAHGGLDVGVARLGADRLAAARGDGGLSAPDDAGVVHDCGARGARQEGLRQEAHQVLARDEVAALVKEEAAVKVPVEGHAEADARRADGLAGGGVIFREEWVRDAVREARVRLVVVARESQRGAARGERFRDGVECGARGAVAGVDEDVQGRQGFDVYEAQDFLDVAAARLEDLSSASPRRSALRQAAASARRLSVWKSVPGSRGRAPAATSFMPL